jgi:tRNA threonylcarbamoyl adenosine modification protein YeaZ
MILAIDTATDACTAALFDGAGAFVSSKDEVIGRGHSERLVPMLAELLEGRRPSQILVGVGPGSFTGIRVALATAHGLAIGWNARLTGFSSLALLALSAPGTGPVAAAVRGGHGELFVQQFERGRALEPASALLNLPPLEAAARIRAPLVIGTGAADLVAARGDGEALEGWPSAERVMSLPADLRSLAPKPLYARAPDAGTRRAA